LATGWNIATGNGDRMDMMRNKSEAALQEEREYREYGRYCGPGAYAAVAGVTRWFAARVLRYWTKKAGLPSDDATGTIPMVLAVALLRQFDIEEWTTAPGRPLIEQGIDEFRARTAEEWATAGASPPEDVVQRLAELIARPPASPHARQIVTAEMAVAAERRKRRLPGKYTVTEWLRRRRAGTWVLFVDGHGMAARDGKITAGDTPNAGRCGKELLTRAWRIRPKQQPERCNQ